MFTLSSPAIANAMLAAALSGNNLIALSKFSGICQGNADIGW
jgi:hypothetical protein